MQVHNESVELVYIFDLIGTFAFSVYGSYVGIKKDFDIVGVLICGMLCGIGGGTIREFMLGNTPFYFFDNSYILAIIAGTIFSILTYKNFAKVNTFMLIMDAIGLATFAYIGAFKAGEAGLGVFAIMFFAGLTATGGGVMKDILVRDIPLTLKTDLYLTPAILTAFAYSLLPLSYRTAPWAAYVFIAIVFCVRTYAIFHKVQLWQPKFWAERQRQWGDFNLRLPFIRMRESQNPKDQ